MALTRSFLKGMGFTDEQVDAIVEAHTETINALKEQRDNYKTDAEKLPKVQKELDALKAAGSGEDEWKEKYEAEHSAFEKFKGEQAAAKDKADKTAAYKALLKEVGVSENRIDSIIKVTNLDDLKLKDGVFTKADELKEAAKTEWKDFIVSSQKKGASTQTPPGNAGGKPMTKEEIYKTDDRGRYVLSTEQRQAALVELNNSSTQ